VYVSSSFGVTEVPYDLSKELHSVEPLFFGIGINIGFGIDHFFKRPIPNPIPVSIPNWCKRLLFCTALRDKPKPRLLAVVAYSH
jgi:hypothetical protein